MPKLSLTLYKAEKTRGYSDLSHNKIERYHDYKVKKVFSFFFGKWENVEKFGGNIVATASQDNTYFFKTTLIYN